MHCGRVGIGVSTLGSGNFASACKYNLPSKHLQTSTIAESREEAVRFGIIFRGNRNSREDVRRWVRRVTHRKQFIAELTTLVPGISPTVSEQERKRWRDRKGKGV